MVSVVLTRGGIIMKKMLVVVLALVAVMAVGMKLMSSKEA